MFTRIDESGRPWALMMSLTLILGLALLGCPETTDDDDASDDDTGDDDTGDDDTADDDTTDDDTGDDDTGDDDVGEGTGTMTLTADSKCGEIQSTLVLDLYGGDMAGKFWGDIVASTEPWTCAQLQQWEKDEWAADDVFWMASDLAYKNQDGPAMCAAFIAYYQALEVIYSAKAPVGSCTLSISPSGIAPGVYDINGQEPLRYYGYVEIIMASYYQAVVDYLAACKGVTTWDDWMMLEYGLYKVAYDAWEWWDIYEGTMTLGQGNDITAVATGNLVENWDSGGTGTLDFDLDAPWCTEAK